MKKNNGKENKMSKDKKEALGIKAALLRSSFVSLCDIYAQVGEHLKVVAQQMEDLVKENEELITKINEFEN